MEQGIANILLQGGIGAIGLAFALYIFKTMIDWMKEQMKDVSGAWKEQAANNSKIVEEMEKHNQKIEELIEELKEFIIDNLKKNEGK